MTAQVVILSFNDLMSDGTFVGFDGVPTNAPAGPVAPWALDVEVLVDDVLYTGDGPALVRQTFTGSGASGGVFERFRSGAINLGTSAWTAWVQK